MLKAKEDVQGSANTSTQIVSSTVGINCNRSRVIVYSEHLREEIEVSSDRLKEAMQPST